uniref:Secreted protein n=1 Tax=Panagrolaimus sp. JU765 TaxID=591449 RepID=A0AC34Q8W9_9BILA
MKIVRKVIMMKFNFDVMGKLSFIIPILPLSVTCLYFNARGTSDGDCLNNLFAFEAQNNPLFANLCLNWNFADGPMPRAGDALPAEDDPPSDKDEKSTDGSEASAHNHPDFFNNGNPVEPAPMNNQLPLNQWAAPSYYYYYDPISMRHLPHYYTFDPKDPGLGGQFFAPTNHPLLSQDVVYSRPGYDNGDMFGFQRALENGGRATKASKKGAPKKKRKKMVLLLSMEEIKTERCR